MREGGRGGWGEGGRKRRVDVRELRREGGGREGLEGGRGGREEVEGGEGGEGGEVGREGRALEREGGR